MYDFNLIPGDVVRRRKGAVWHWGVCIQEGIVHNTPEKGEHISSLAEFADVQQIEVFRPHDINRHEIISRAYEIVNNPSDYQYLWRNCEHTVTEIIKGEAMSQTVKSLATLAFIISSAYLVIRYHNQITRVVRYMS